MSDKKPSMSEKSQLSGDRQRKAAEIVKRILSHQPKGEQLMIFLKRIGLPYATFSDWRRGKRFPREEKLAEIADNLTVTLPWLLHGRDDDNLAGGCAWPREPMMPSHSAPLYSGTIKDDAYHKGGKTGPEPKGVTTIPAHAAPEFWDPSAHVMPLELDNLGDSMAPLPAGSIVYVDTMSDGQMTPFKAVESMPSAYKTRRSRFDTSKRPSMVFSCLPRINVSRSLKSSPGPPTFGNSSSGGVVFFTKSLRGVVVE